MTIPYAPSEDYRPGDRVRVSPIGDPPFFGYVTDVGKRAVLVREDPAFRPVAWSRTVVEPAPENIPDSVLVSRDTLEALLADATEALSDLRMRDESGVAFDRVWDIVYNTSILLGREVR